NILLIARPAHLLSPVPNHGSSPMTAPPTASFATVFWRGEPAQIEYQWVGSDKDDAPLMVFLHEGLGSLSMWKDFPARLCEAGEFRGLVFSRPGYGRSTPRLPNVA